MISRLPVWPVCIGRISRRCGFTGRHVLIAQNQDFKSANASWVSSEEGSVGSQGPPMYSIGISTGLLAPPDGIAHASRSSAHAFRPSQVSSDLRSRRTHSSASRSIAKRSTLIVPVDRSRIRPRNGRRFISGSQSDGCTVRQRWDPMISSRGVMTTLRSSTTAKQVSILRGAKKRHGARSDQ